MIVAAGIGFAIACVWVVWQFINAPEGYEDETGFHFGRKDHTE